MNISIHLTNRSIPKGIVRRRLFFMSWVSLQFAFSLLHAELPNPSEDQDKMPVFELGKLIVYGNSVDPVESLSDEVEGYSIERLEIDNVATALNTLPGVTLTRFGPRNEEAVYIRGFDRRQVSIYVDGVPVSVPYDGFADLARFTTMDIASISLTKGYGSVLSGPNGFGGVVNIISSQTAAPFSLKSKVGVFSGDGYNGSLSVGGAEEHWFYQLSAGYSEFETYPLPDDYEPTGTEDGGNRDNAYEKDWKLAGKIGFRPNTSDEYVFGFTHQEAEKGTPAYAGTDPTTRARFWQWPEWNKSTAYLTGKIQRESFYLHPRLYYDRYDNTLESYDDDTYTTMNKKSSFISIYDDYSYGASIEGGTSHTDKLSVRGAVHYKIDHHDEHDAGAEHFVFEDSIWSSGVEMTYVMSDKWSVQTGVSYDFMETEEAVDTNTGNSIDGTDFSAFNPQIALFYKIEDASSIHLGVSKRSRFPTIKDRYSYKMGTALAAPGLDPESVVHYELGYTGNLTDKLWVSTSLFLSKIDDLIESVAKVAFDEEGSALSQNQNVGEAEHSGFELALTYAFSEQLSLSADYTYLSRKNLYSPELAPTYTPRNSGSIHAEYHPVKWLTLVPYVEYSDERFTSTDGTKVDSYVIVNFKALFDINDNFRVDVGSRNLTDVSYQYQEGYPEAGRTWYGSLNYRF